MELTTRLSCNPKQLDSMHEDQAPPSPRHRRDCHPLSCSVPRDFSRGRGRSLSCRLQFGTRNPRTDLQDELRPVQSPLLRPSQLVSFPPLSYMLKFSGSSHSIGGPITNSSRRVVVVVAHRVMNNSSTHTPKTGRVFLSQKERGR